MNQNQVVRRVAPFFLVLLPLLLAGCSESWPLAATKSGDGSALLLPSCATRSVVGVRVFDEATLKVVWEISAPQPGTDTQAFVVGQAEPGFDVVVPLMDDLSAGATYEAIVIFEGQAGPTSGVRFDVSNLEVGSLWFDDHRGTREEFDASAEESGLCGASASFKSIFWTKFGAGCAVVLIALVGFGYWWSRRRRPSAA